MANLNDALFTMWIPLAVALVFGIIGLFRGAVKETIVSASIVLGALINEQWSALWAEDIAGTFAGFGQGDVQFGLSLLLLSLVVLVVGYLLSGAIATEAPRSGMRLFGLVLGLLNGAAVAGWILRYAFLGLDAAQTTSPLYQNAVSQGFMIWAGWFPVTLAIVAAVIALAQPLRRAQSVVGEPSPTTDWRPSSRTETTPSPPSTYYATGADQRPVPAPPSPTGAATQVFPPDPVDSSPRETRPMPVTAPYSEPTDVGSTSAPADRATTTLGAGEEKAPAATPLSTWQQNTEPSWLVGEPPPAESNAAVSNPGTGPQSVAGASKPTPPAPLTPSVSGEAPGLTGRTCSNCGSNLPAGAAFCTECGTRVQA